MDKVLGTNFLKRNTNYILLLSNIEHELIQLLSSLTDR